MRRYRIFFPVLFVNFLLLINLAKGADPISVIRYPLTTQPAILRAGDPLVITCNASATASNWQARIFTLYNEVKLTVKPVYDSALQLWKLTTTIPENTPFELYHLEVTAGGVSDQMIHAVKVVQNFKHSYYFVHLPDLHLPSVSWIGYYDDANTIPEFLQVNKELELINPEFILQTGDVVDNGRQEDQYRIAQDLLAKLQQPVYMAGGNHDLWYDGHTNWHKYFNPVMDYSFQYGSHHFAGMEMYDIPTVTFTAEQMLWLQNDLQASIDRNDPLRILFYHYDESRQIDADFVDAYFIDLILYGHTHINGENTIGNHPALNLNTSFTMNNNKEYRLVKIANDQIQEYPVLSAGSLSCIYSPANDGTNRQVRAKIRNDNSISFEHGLIKFFVRHDPAGYQVQGGTVAQIITADTLDIYYVNVNIAENSQQEVSIVSVSPPADNPPVISAFSPAADTAIYAGIQTNFSVQAVDSDNQSLTFSWYRDGTTVPGAEQASFNFVPEVGFTGVTYLSVRVSDGEFYDEQEWMVEVLPFSNKPMVLTSVVNFFPHDQSLTIQWFEPTPIDANFEFGLTPGVYTGSIPESGNNHVTFTPELAGMGLGKYYCRISDGTISSDPFVVVIESPKAPRMLAPLGNIQFLSPSFSWAGVPGVPYYMVICSDQEIRISEDPVTGEISVEGANPIWAVLTSETSVPYGIEDPSGTFTSVPAPLTPGSSYWWVVLNCYGNAPELTSPVQSGISMFTVDLPPPDLSAPALISPDNGATLTADVITFKWQPVENATAYHFYPFKIEQESGIETARALWENIIATTDQSYDYPAGDMLIEGHYRWKVAAVAADGMEVHSETRDFTYSAPSATLTIHTYDNKNTAGDITDDLSLPRVSITFSALDGIYNGLPLSTDLHGLRENYKIAPGAYRFVVEKEGFDTIIDTLTFANGQTYQLQYRLSPSKSRITGKVVDNLDESLSDAEVTARHTLHPEITKSTVTDAMGNFSLALLPGTYQVQAEKDEYEPSASISISVAPGEVKSLATLLKLNKNKNIISGTVLNTEHQAVLGVKIVLSGKDVQFDKMTDANGFFQFIVPNGTWKLYVEKSGFVSPGVRNLSVSGGSNITVSPPITLTPNAAIIQGQVRDGFRFLRDVTIKAFPAAGTPYQVVSDAYGQFSLNVLPGVYTLLAEKTGYTFQQNLQITLAAGQTQSGVEIQLAAAQSVIRGKATLDGFTPVKDVQISNANLTTFTSEAGAYELGVDYGSHVISAGKSGYTISPPESVTVAPGQVVENVDFILTPNASAIKGRITSSGGGVVRAQIRASNSTDVVSTSDETGYYSLNLEAGTWNLSVAKNGFITAYKENVPVGIGQTISGINFYLAPNITTVSGIVTDTQTRLPLRNAEVKIAEKELSSHSSGDGSYSLVVEPGNYSLVVTKPGYKTRLQSTGDLQANQTKSIDFDLEALPSRFAGRVADQNSESLSGVHLLAVEGSNRYEAVSEPDGQFRLDVQPGVYSISGSKSGYKSATLPGAESIFAGETKSLSDLQLQRNFGNIAGTIKVKGSGRVIGAARVVVQENSGFSAQTNSDNDGNFHFWDAAGQAVLLPGTYQAAVTKNGFKPYFEENIAVNGGAVVTLQVELEKNLGKITGTVSAAAGPVAGASITVQQISTRLVFTAISQANGYFEITGLPQGNYEIRVAKTGYTSPDPQNVAPGSSVQLTLLKNNGRLFGVITDAEISILISGVSVVVDDQHGNNGGAHSNAQGFYEITNLPRLFPYQIRVRKGGYSGIDRPTTQISSDTEINFQMQRLYGNISGSVVNEENLPMVNMIISVSSSIFSAKDSTDAAGKFQFLHLPSYSYKVTAQKIGFLSDPVEQYVSLWQGGDVTNVNFSMREAKAASIKIIGLDNLSNTEKQRYTFSAKTANMKEASIEPEWEINLVQAVDSLSQDGLLDPKNDFIGTLELKLTDRYSGITGKKAISVYQMVGPGAGLLHISNQQGIQLILQDSSVSQNITIQLKKPNFAEIRRNTRSFKVVGDIYQFMPENFHLLKPAELLLPIPAETTAENVTAGKWDSKWLEWKAIPATPAGNSQLKIMIAELGRYGILEQAEPLAVKNIHITPNPFSPLNAPVEIEYEVSSDQTPNPEVTIRIYNMIGDLVKTLLPGEAQPRGLNTVTWDGMTGHGRMAKNGRYVLHFQVKDITGTKEDLKPFVLIK